MRYTRGLFPTTTSMRLWTMNQCAPSLPTLEMRLAQQQRPAGRAVMYQSWRELLFLHWRVDPDLVQSRLPGGLTIDTYEGDCWIGIVPFFMRDIRPWWSPAIPGISDFQEVNLRTYVVDENGVPGVWFLSLDANTRLGTWWGRTFYQLPYRYARMQHCWDRQTGRVDCTAQRSKTTEKLISRFCYQPSGPLAIAEPGSLEFFLVERYVLFARTRDAQIASGRVHHPPYQVCAAEAEGNDALFELNGLPRPHRPADHQLISRGVDVEIFALQPSSD